MNKVFITGISGFAGSHLADHLLNLGRYEVSGTYLNENSLSNLPRKEELKLHKLNLLDAQATRKILLQEKPNLLFHLAAIASPRASISQPSEIFTNNVTSQINILEAIKDLPETKILVVSSAEVYGLVAKEDLPIDEETPFIPTNPYAVSKLAQDYLGLQYFISNKVKVIRVRPFNHVGPRQAPSFVVSAFAKRIVEIEKGKEKIMRVGNLASKRDLTDVRDMVKAYLLAIEGGQAGDVYNLGSGVSRQIQEVLDMMIAMAKTKIETEEDSALLMPSDNPELVCDYSKFNALTGWKPEIPIERTLQETLEYWRKVI